MLLAPPPPVPLQHPLALNLGPSIWTRGTSFASLAHLEHGPDMWRYYKNGTSTLAITQETTTGLKPVDCKTSMKLVYVQNNSSTLYQRIEDYRSLRGRRVTFTAKVDANTASAVRPYIYDSVNGYVYGTYHAGSGGYATLSITSTIGTGANEVGVGFYLNASHTSYIANMTFTITDAPVPYMPLSLAEDALMCARYCQKIGGSASLYVLNAFNLNTTSAYWGFGLPVPMGGTPTITWSGSLSDWQVMDGYTGLDSLAVSSFSIVAADPMWISGIANVSAGTPLLTPGCGSLFYNSASRFILLEWNIP